MHQFDDIRPYSDKEVPEVVARLARDKEFIKVIAHFRYPTLGKKLPWLINWLIKLGLINHVKKIKNIKDLQERVSSYVDTVIENSTTEFSLSGLEQIKPEVGYLFISNHRDIVLDPTLVNYSIHRKKQETAQIAIGDNLLKKPFVADLMRLNKSFIVKRSPESRREKLFELNRLSAYINHCIDTKQSVWLAQSEGRAKDGNDQTDTAIIKMLHMSQRKSSLRFSEEIKKLAIVPVSISYEFDPCDYLKAKELDIRNKQGSYDKADNEDITSIVKGIMGDKGKVHVSFGEQLVDDYRDPLAVAEAIDKQILANYKLHGSNVLAYQLLKNQGQKLPNLSSEEIKLGEQTDKEQFMQRLDGLCPSTQKFLLKMYAQPLINKKS